MQCACVCGGRVWLCVAVCAEQPYRSNTSLSHLSRVSLCCQEIISSGDIPAHFYIIKSGVVKVRVRVGWGRCGVYGETNNKDSRPVFDPFVLPFAIKLSTLFNF